MTSRWEVINHTADLALRVYGRDLPDLFVSAALAMFDQVDPIAVCNRAPTAERQVHVDGDDRESLLVNWLNELLYLHETHREAYFHFTLRSLHCDPASHPDRRRQSAALPRASRCTLSALVCGAPSLHPQRLIKAATYHGLRIEPGPQGLAATIVFDV